jgi:type IV pilus assembly protein PilV
MHQPLGKRHQGGVMLIEVLIAILIFSVGILGIVGLQATAVTQVTDARYRTDAALLANQLLGQMWASGVEPATLQTRFQTQTSATSDYALWVATVRATLPGVTTTVGGATTPTVAVSNTGVVTVTIRWRAPNEPATADPHSYVTLAQIKYGG